MQSLKSRHKIRKIEIQTEGGELKYIKLTPYSGGRIEVRVHPGKAEPIELYRIPFSLTLEEYQQLNAILGKVYSEKLI